MFQPTLPLTDPTNNYSATTDRRVINFESMAKYSIYKDIMFLNYGRNQYVQKNEVNNGIVYSFKFRGEEVFITLCYAQHGTLYINGNGCKNWFHEAHVILDQQCERHFSGKLQIPEALPEIGLSGKLQIPESLPEIGEKKKELVSEEEFHKCFAIPNVYGTSDFKWPHSAILLYKYSSNATTEHWDIPENTWKRVNNVPFKKGESDGKHAELIMIEDLEKIQEYLTVQPDDYKGSNKAILSVEVILNYSPCHECSESLCQLKETLDEKVKISKTTNYSRDTVLENLSALSLKTEVEEVEKIQMKITFSNFYNHKVICNREGLRNLMKSDIKLDIFTDDNWKYFFKAAGLVTERQLRERVDKKILQYLEESVALEATTNYLEKLRLI